MTAGEPLSRNVRSPGAQDGGQLVVDDLDDDLAGVDALEHVLADGALLDTRHEVLDDLVVDVRLEQREADLAHGGVDVGLGDPAVAGQLAEDVAQAVAEGIEHGMASLDDGPPGAPRDDGPGRHGGLREAHHRAPMTRRTVSLGAPLGVRPHEGGRVLAVAALFAVVEAGRALGEVGVETLVQGRFGPSGLPTVLPWLYMALGALGLVVAVVFGAALGRVERGPLFVAVLGLAAGVMVLGWLALPSGSDAVLVGLWLAVSLVATLLMSITWTVAGSAFDARQARRIFPLLTAAAIAGGFVGSLAAGPLTGLLGAPDLVVIEAAGLAGAMPLVGVLARRTRLHARTEPRGSVIDEMRRGMDIVGASPLLRRIAACYVLLAVLMFSIQYPFTVAARRPFPATRSGRPRWASCPHR